jgi:PhnB protein
MELVNVANTLNLAKFIKACTRLSVNLQFTDTAEAERVFSALAENGTIRMPISETFWSKRFGMVVDQFGTPWMVNCA